MEQLIRSLSKACTLGIYEAKVNVFLLSDYSVLLVTAFCRSYLQSPIIPNQGGLIFFFPQSIKTLAFNSGETGLNCSKDRQYVYTKYILALNLKQLRWDSAVKSKTVSQADLCCVLMWLKCQIYCAQLRRNFAIDVHGLYIPTLHLSAGKCFAMCFCH